MLEELIDLDAIFKQALEETIQMIQLGIDISEPCVVTSLEWYANKYPEIAERCNNTLMELIEKQSVMYPELKVLNFDISNHSF
jgi:hypothetical protein